MNKFAELEWRMEANEAAFCSMWTDRIRVNEANLFINKKMPLDYFYNRLNLYETKNLTGVLRKAERTFFRGNMNCYIHVLENNIEIQNTLLSSGFSWIDTMDVMVLDSESACEGQSGIGGISVVRVDYVKIPSWVKTFCESFEISELQTEIQQIIELHFDKLTLLISYLSSGISTPKFGGCCALFVDQRLVGLYCLGTISEYRGRGLAKNMMTYGLRHIVNSGLDHLFLQTFESQDLFRFYRKLGFQLAYKKRVYEKKYHEVSNP